MFDLQNSPPMGMVRHRMRFVRAICEMAPGDARKSVALRRYLAAERAMEFGDVQECIRRLDAAIVALR